MQRRVCNSVSLSQKILKDPIAADKLQIKQQ